MGLLFRGACSGRKILRQQHALLDAAIKVVGNRYHTTMLIARRIRQLHHGARPQVSHEEADSFFTIAVREIAAGHLSFEPVPIPENAPPVPIAISDNGTREGDGEEAKTPETANDGV